MGETHRLSLSCISCRFVVAHLPLAKPGRVPIDRPASTRLLADWTMAAKSTDQKIAMQLEKRKAKK